MYIADIGLAHLYTFRTRSQYCVTKTIGDFFQNLGNIGAIFMSASNRARAERVAIRLTPCEFNHFQAGCPASARGHAQNARPLERARHRGIHGDLLEITRTVGRR